MWLDGGRNSQWVERRKFKSEDPGFDPLAGQGDEQFVYPSESTLVETDLFVCA